jgi:hypothetical protein
VGSERRTDGGDPGGSGGSEYLIEKCFDDFADDIEAVTIHYAWSPVGDVPNWDEERVSRFMPAESPEGAEAPSSRRARMLRLPAQIMTKAGVPTDHYLLHHYFEYWQGGFRHYSPHFTEEIVTGGGEK